MKMETRNGAREIEVQTLKRRSPPPINGNPPRRHKDLPLDMFDLIARIVVIRNMAHTVERGHGDAEASASNKNELVRALGRLEADLRRRGVR